MIRKILGIILLAHTATADVKPDVSFSDTNNRFDLSEMVNARNKMFRDNPQEDDDDDEGVASDGDYRRNYNTDKYRSIHPTSNFLTRREDFDFAYDPDNLPTIGRAGDDDMVDLEYQENLRNFKMNIPKPGRRKIEDNKLEDITDEQKHEADILLHNVVPITMTIDGYLKAPLQDLVSLYAQQGKRIMLKTD
ncbi:hypothetical protein PYW08_009013 [Mythimna loreyi]|uniref:Uncharacterized protein n=1 Tax=Mythimna loreyi TaxID=667449 RepID=A0ACC2Q9V2_9NEOP|nr:hypothetical protein PYW08_009013 [Mythimna loreyi]